MEEENQGPQLDAATPEFDEAIRSGRFDAEEVAEDESGEVGGPSSLLAALDEAEGKTPADEQPKPEGVQPQQQDPPQEDWKRKAESYAGNNRQLQAMVAETKRQNAAFQQRLAQIEAQAAQERDLAQIRQSVPAELQDDAIADYHARRQSGEREQGLEAYRGFLQSQQAQIQQAQVGLFRQSLPHEMPDFLGFVAEQAQAPVEPLLEMAQTDAFRDLYSMLDSQRDLDLVAQVALAFGQVEAKKDKARKETNRTQAVQARTHRDVSAGGGSTGGTGQDVETRMNGMTDAQFIKFAENVRRAGSLRGQ